MPASSEPPPDTDNLPLSSQGADSLPRSAQDADSLPLSSQERGLGGEVIRTVTLPATVALHARPAAVLVRAASKVPTPVTIAANGKRANARSILEVLALGAMGGTDVTLSATGPGAGEAVNALAVVIAGFGA